MKAKTMLYWTATCLIALETFAGGVMDLTHGRTGVVSGPFVAQVVSSLRCPMYILAIIGICKIPGAVTLVVPGFLRLKEWAYAGIVFELSGAAASHAACGNWGELIAPLSLLFLAIASWALRPPGRMIGAGCIRTATNASTAAFACRTNRPMVSHCAGVVRAFRAAATKAR